MPSDPTSSPAPQPASTLLAVPILLVDDRPANLVALRAVLDDLGHVLVTATSGEEALSRLREQDFAVVLLDVVMPGMDGLQTAQRLRGQERSRHTPIIFLTAQAGDDFVATEAYHLGAVDFLIKPLNPAAVRAKVAVFAELFAQRALVRRQAEQTRLLIQGTTDYAIFMLDPEGRVATWNAGAERIKGYTAEEIIGQHFSRFYPPEAIERGWPAEELRQATAAGRVEDEGWRLRKDGSRFWANVVITALRDESGGLRGFAKVTRDLSERKRAEDALRRAHDELEAKVAERTRELTEANARLAEASRRKDEFLAMLAHELRNPLAPVLTGLHLLGLSATDRQAVEQTRGMVERQIRHLTRLVDDLLDVARISRGGVPVRRERLDLVPLVRTAAEDRRPLVEHAGMALLVEVPDTPVWVAGDGVRLVQVMNNLLDNAVKFRNGGESVSVRVTVDAVRDEAVLTVSDRGVGIPADLFPRLFDTFAQADRSLDRARGGLGLGLSVVKGLVELHGGRVEVVSEGPGHGATFTVRLPLMTEVPALSEAPPQELPVAGEPLRVLVVEDNHDAADSLRMLLELLGHRVAVAYTGPDGVELARVFRPDVVLCDLGLPGLDGYGVADELRRDPRTAKAHLIAVTGYGGEQDRQRSREAGFDVHLTKPVAPEVLLRTLAQRAS